MTMPAGREPLRSVPTGLPTGDLLATGPITADLAVPDRALAIGAHPDDIEFGCGATLARWAAAGCQVHHLILTDGSKGSWDVTADIPALIRTRQEEARAAARVLDGDRVFGGRAATVLAGIPDDWPSIDVSPRENGSSIGTGTATGTTGHERVSFLGRVDGELQNGSEERRQVARIMRTIQPGVVLAHDPWRRYRLHPDHRAAGFLALDSVVAARDPHFFADLGLPPHRPTSILLWEADVPNHVEASGGFEQVKIDALLCHRSQFESTMGIGNHERDVFDGRLGATPGQFAVTTADRERRAFSAKVRQQLAQHGSLAGLSSAEAFHLLSDI